MIAGTRVQPNKRNKLRNNQIKMLRQRQLPNAEMRNTAASKFVYAICRFTCFAGNSKAWTAQMLQGKQIWNIQAHAQGR